MYDIYSPARKKTSYSDQTRYLVNILHTKLNKLLSPCSNFWKPLKKFRNLSVQPGLCNSNDLRVDRNMATFKLIFQSRKQVVVRRGQIRKVEDQDIGSRGKPVSSGLQVPGEMGVVLQE